jgi:hypothetical protein
MFVMDRPCTKNGCQFSPAHSTQLDTRREEKKRKTKRNMKTYHSEGEERVWFRIIDRGSKISPGQKQMERTCFQPYYTRGEKELRHVSHMTLEIQVLTWSRYKNVAGLNRLIGVCI